MTEERPESSTFGEIAEGLLADGFGFRFCAKGRSMLPLIHDGDILHVQRATAANLKVGDIVLFQQNKNFKAHRIVRKQPDSFVTHGDAGEEADGVITARHIVGKIVARECAMTGCILPLDGVGIRLGFFLTQALRQARKYLSRSLGSATQ